MVQDAWFDGDAHNQSMNRPRGDFWLASVSEGCGLTIRVGFGSILYYYNHNKEPANPSLSIKVPLRDIRAECFRIRILAFGRFGLATQSPYASRDLVIGSLRGCRALNMRSLEAWGHISGLGGLSGSHTSKKNTSFQGTNQLQLWTRLQNPGKTCLIRTYPKSE